MDHEDVPEAVAIGEKQLPGTTEDEGPKKAIPVTLITGYLGSGKTTLIRHILHSDHGHRIAVILNEFGESTGIETAFIKNEEGIQDRLGGWVDLPNGCMCCTVKSDLVSALEALLEQRSQFDYIVIETTGLANPAPIASALWSDTELEAGVMLDCVVTVVDALHIGKQMSNARESGGVNEAQLQIAYADLVVLNKMDLAQDEAVRVAEADVRAVNSSVQIVRTKHSSVDIGLLLNKKLYCNRRPEACLPAIFEDDDDDDALARELIRPSKSASVPRVRQLETGNADLESQGSLSGDDSVSLGTSPLARRSFSTPHRRHDDCDTVHSGDVRSVMLTTSGLVDRGKLQSWIDSLLWEREVIPEDVLRMKGVLSFKGSNHMHMLQAVYELYEITEGPAWQPSETRISKLVLIGRFLNQKKLQAALDQCVVDV